MMKKITRAFYQWHQQLGLAVGLGLIFWALSGLAHPIISRINPSAAQFTGLNFPLQQQVIDTAFINQQFPHIDHLRIFNVGDSNVARIESQGKTHYWNALSWQALDAMETDYAIQLARHFSGDTHSTIASVTVINQFDNDYLSINKLLPVTRVEFKRPDALRVYVDTQQGRLATLVDNNKALTGTFFRALHTWHWWPASTAKTLSLSVLLIAIHLLLLMGLWLYIQRWRQGVFNSNARWPRSRRWHAHISGGVAFLALCFVSSGLLHFLVSQDSASSLPLNNPLKPTALSIQPNQVDLQWVSTKSSGYWRSVEQQTATVSTNSTAPTPHAHAEHGAKLNPTFSVVYKTLSVIQPNAEMALTKAMAQQWHAGQIINLSPQTHFSNEYGFINKRLPVVKVSYADNTVLFIEPHSRSLAAMVSNLDAFESASFGYLHKWHHLDFLGKGLRDCLLSIAALLIIVGTGIGFYRYLCSRPSPQDTK